MTLINTIVPLVTKLKRSNPTAPFHDGTQKRGKYCHGIYK